VANFFWATLYIELPNQLELSISLKHAEEHENCRRLDVIFNNEALSVWSYVIITSLLEQ